MSDFKEFRISGTNKGQEFYFKMKDEDGKLMGTWAVAYDGLYYYRKGSHILTPEESDEALDTYDGFLSFEKLKDLFDNLAKIGWSRKDGDDSQISVSLEEDQIVMKREGS